LLHVGTVYLTKPVYHRFNQLLASRRRAVFVGVWEKITLQIGSPGVDILDQGDAIKQRHEILGLRRRRLLEALNFGQSARDIKLVVALRNCDAVHDYVAADEFANNLVRRDRRLELIVAGPKSLVARREPQPERERQISANHALSPQLADDLLVGCPGADGNDL